jgi:hypothetical protein
MTKILIVDDQAEASYQAQEIVGRFFAGKITLGG